MCIFINLYMYICVYTYIYTYIYYTVSNVLSDCFFKFIHPVNRPFYCAVIYICIYILELDSL